MASMRKELETQIENIKAYSSLNSGLEDQNRMFKFTIEQIGASNDSLIVKMRNLQDKLKIKDRDLKQLQYRLSEATKKDTIIFRDTIFSNPSIDVDTIVGDKWYTLKLALKYPNTIISEPSFISEESVFFYYKKETVRPRKKFFLARWFQRKHKVVKIKVVEESPYVKDREKVFIDVIK